MRLDPLHAADQVDAGQDVRPLVIAADLQQASVAAVQLQEVVRLQQQVVELQEGEAGLQAAAVGLEAEHPVHGETGADLAQEVQVPKLGEPGGVVDHGGMAEVDDAAHLPLHQLGVANDGLHRQQRPHVVLVRRIAHAGGGAADQQHRLVAGALQVRHGKQTDQVAGVQAGPGGVDAEVEGDPIALQQRGERPRVGGLLDQPAPGQGGQHVHQEPSARE